MLEEQQFIADTFYRQNLIPKQIRVKDVFWQPSLQQASGK
jgi:ABC-type nitrate/sulfonate/bicarbonate transport system substrate-binding protein